jgi:hypothetical protein
MSTRAALTRQDESHLDAAGWALLGLALLIVGLSCAQALYRMGLPSEGWSFVRDLSGAGQRLVFDSNVADAPSPLQAGDMLVAVDGQPVESILARALTLRPQRPADWTAGRAVPYTVLRAGRSLTLDVPLVRCPTAMGLRDIGGNFLRHPGVVPALLIGLFVFLRRPRSRPAQLLLLICACFFASEGISQAVGDSNVLGPSVLFDRTIFWPAQFFNSLIWPFVVAPLFLHLFLRFPSLKWPLRAYPRLAPAALYGLMPALTLLALALNWGRPLDFWRTWSALSAVDYFATLTAVILSMVHTLLTMRDPAGRAQIRWVAWGALVTCVGAVAGGVLVSAGALGERSLLAFLAYRLPMLAFPAAIAIAILRYRLFEIDIIINRTLVYGALTAVLALVYAACVVLLQELFRALTGEGQDELVTVGSTLAIAVLFNPLRRRIQVAIDRRFYRRRYDMARTLQSFNATLRDEVDLNRLAVDLLTVVDETMRPAHVSLWLRTDSATHIEALPAQVRT